MSFTQAELAAMYAEAVMNRDAVKEIERLGGAPSNLLNVIFDADVVLGMYRKKRGGIGFMAVKGRDHCRRVMERGESEFLRLAKYELGTAEACRVIADRYEAKPDARWEEAYVDGQRIGFGLT